MAYPKLQVNQDILKQNVKSVLKICGDAGIRVTGVIKGVNGLLEITKIVIQSGVKTIASSRLCQLRQAREIDPTIETYALRVPMLTEIEELVDSADISLNSDLEVIRKINDVCLEKGKIHKVIIMVDLGDLREGIMDDDELAETVHVIEKELSNIHLYGIGVNLGCYGSILPTVEKMDELIEKAHFIKNIIGRELEIISGGATTSFPLIARGEMPEGVNELRIGDGLYVSDLDDCFNYEMHEQEALILQAEIIEIKDKPSHPIGKIAVNAFGDKEVYEDKGVRRRALIAVGRQDIGDYHHILPLDKDMDVIGGSSDHTIIDIEDCQKDYQIGDILEFHVMYGSMMMCTQSEYVEKEYI